MRQVQLKMLDEDSIKTLASGERLQLVVDNTSVAEIVPTDQDALLQQQSQWERERQQATTELFAMMEKGFDMGGFRIANRDELYDRDPQL